ncbi:hypothetical protein [Paenibacillus stellifer]|nr:hypothetical protein [Paenibacillus stellifer]
MGCAASLILLRVPASGGQVPFVTRLTLTGLREMNTAGPASGPAL